VIVQYIDKCSMGSRRWSFLAVQWWGPQVGRRRLLSPLIMRDPSSCSRLIESLSLFRINISRSWWIVLRVDCWWVNQVWRFIAHTLQYGLFTGDSGKTSICSFTFHHWPHLLLISAAQLFSEAYPLKFGWWRILRHFYFWPSLKFIYNISINFRVIYV
jgi:hypothetical protein